MQKRSHDTAPIISVSNVSKTYASGFQALKRIDLDIRRGEIFALLGPNGAGKTTLISIICGIVNASEGTVTVDGHDIVADYRAARSLIGLVPQELTTDAFETVWATVSFSRGLFGKPNEPRPHREGAQGALAVGQEGQQDHDAVGRHEAPGHDRQGALRTSRRILFLDEPTAGVDVELRKDMWGLVRRLRDSGVTIILTTHYIEEAEEMADRIGVINKGELILVEDKADADAQARQEAADAAAARAGWMPCRPSWRPTASRSPTAAASSSTPTTRRASAPASRRCSPTSAAPASASAISTPRKARSRTSSSTW